MLSHRNMVAGAKSVACYLGNQAGDTLLAALPLSFDAGFSQLTTAFHAGARVVLLNYLLPRDVLKALAREKVTGLTAVPPLYIQLTQLEWPAAIDEHLRYFANTGGRMPRETLDALRTATAEDQAVPDVRPDRGLPLHLLAARRGRPPPGLDRQGHPQCRDPGAARRRHGVRTRRAGRTGAPRRPGGQGYWNDPEKTAERYKLLPGCAGPQAGWCCPNTPSSPATPCAWTRKASCTSSAGATR